LAALGAGFSRFLVGLRDRALIGVMVYAFARVSAVVSLKVEDYFPLQKRWWLRLK
jgi:site-specific recombinase XerD